MDGGRGWMARLLAVLVVTAGVSGLAAAMLLDGSAEQAVPALLAAARPAAEAPAEAVPAEAPAAAPVPAPEKGGAPAVPPRLATLPAQTTQAILVDSPSPASTTATVSAWTRTGSGWTAFVPPTPASLGRDGMGPSSEQVARSPAGTFGISQAFGREANPGTALPYSHVGPDDWWVGDTRSPLYNTHQTCAPGRCPFDERASENLEAAGHAYDHAIVIDANSDPVRPGAGSAYFLHIGGDRPTAGCVATDEGDVITMLRWLTPSAHPMISLASG
ncbi:L,D-transpeptidase family protein [Actinomycetospora endophytica]|uniref:L,D-transpeptidase family protein n=1 Tax=Actinomycetospora endophytica TaxID=2291215 RepID=A0ABS8PCZ2_9PSEU|nr:L,D-transpeptidase family protein [Actinomycetospora endophytica]MCD2196024.1 L,D-transpeptidase family protein [Actinomycetospora endophytica]